MSIEHIIIFGLVIFCVIALIFGYIMNHNPFIYPYFDYIFDVSGKRLPKMEDYIDRFLIDNGFRQVQAHKNKIEDWKKSSEQYISTCKIFKKQRQEQYQRTIDDARAFRFHFVRSQTRYKQVNYVKSSYKVQVGDRDSFYDYKWLEDRNKKLADINFECTLSEYQSKGQRKLMTKALRDKIKIRDNYTCQICGKYMPDEVGLQIDHIIPISKGGKSIESNLQVLCSKCNGSKSDKVITE